MDRQPSNSCNLFSPIEFNNGGATDSFFSPSSEESSTNKGCSATPRRKLCLDSLDDSLQSPRTTSLTSTDSAYNSIVGDISSSLYTEDPISTGNSDMKLSMDDIQEESFSTGRKQLYARRKKRQFSLGLLNKENQCNENMSSSKSSPLLHSSLSLSPLMTSVHTKSLIRQISSPLERMTLISPSSTISASDSCDGYSSEVFDSMDEGDCRGDNSPMPKSFASLFTAPVKSTISSKQDNTPVRQILGVSKRGSLKRSNLSWDTPKEKKPKKSPTLSSSPPSPSPPRKSLKGTTLFRSQSLSVPPCENAMFPDSPNEGSVEKIGDHSKPYLLPLIKGPIPDLKSISSHTLSSLLQGEYKEELKTYTIVDCRYPYEHEGGHIKGSVNIWEKDKLIETFFASPTHPGTERQIIIFHCEFSSKRGPEMSRFMRKMDREKNGMNFPSLYYPELYLLEGGYKKFYEACPNLCEPMSYKTMHDEHHKDELRHFTKRSKSWTSGGDYTTTNRRLLRHRHSVHDTTSMHSSHSWS